MLCDLLVSETVCSRSESLGVDNGGACMYALNSIRQAMLTRGKNPSVMLYGPGDARIEDRPAPTITEPTDAIIRIKFVGVCGSDVSINVMLQDGQRPIHSTGALLESWGRQWKVREPECTLDDGP